MPMMIGDDSGLAGGFWPSCGGAEGFGGAGGLNVPVTVISVSLSDIVALVQLGINFSGK
jgi:hypothetical protein